MTTIKTAHPSGVEGLITTFQIKEIMRNCAYQKDTKDEWVQWVTGDVNRTSLKSITHDEAIRIIKQQTGSPPTTEGGISGAEYRAAFDKNNPKHKIILSLCRQANWTKQHTTHGEVADLERLNNWLNSDKCPVQKPLSKMNDTEIQKIIKALTGIVKSIYK